MKNTCQRVTFFVNLPNTLLNKNSFTDNSQRFNQGNRSSLENYTSNNTTQHETTRVQHDTTQDTMRKHEYNTTQHETTRAQHKTTRAQYEYKTT